MKFIKKILLVNNIKLPVNASVKEAFSVAKRTLRRGGLDSFAEDYVIYRRSVDARRKPDIFYVYTIAVSGDFPDVPHDLQKKIGISIEELKPFVMPALGDTGLSAPPVVVGSGPCGLFAALILAEAGYRPIILERGGSVQERKLTVDRFNREQILDPETNIQFGAGGAGTFSD